MSVVRVGVIGCGAIGQIQHLPNLTSLPDAFEVTVVCDLSPSLAKSVAAAFHVPRHTTDVREVLRSGSVDAVVLCHADPKAEVAVAAFEAGKHVFVEKPMCFSLREADAILEAAARAGTVGQVGYMKLYDPAFEAALAEVSRMDDVRFVQVNHLHPNNALHLKEFRLMRFEDFPEDAGRTIRAARQASLREAVGEVSPEAERAFFTLAGSMIHDLYGLRTMLGVPDTVVSTEVWNEGRGITTVLAYPGGARCAATWVDLPDLWDFKETLEVYGDRKRVIVSYPTGFARGILSEVTVHEIRPDGTPMRWQPAVAWESAFVRELRHFHASITQGAPVRTPVADARKDVALVIDIVRSYLTGGSVARAGD